MRTSGSAQGAWKPGSVVDDARLRGAEGESSVLSVSGALALAKGALEGVSVRLVGEVSELSDKPGYKAVYFSVKDKAASLPCMMWSNRYRSSGVVLRVGMLVELTGRFTLYAAKGRMNFDVFSVALAGEGNLRLQVANLACKLQAEGLMDPARKRVLPALPEVVGLVTSPRGAAVHDVLRTLRRRYPMARIVLAGVPVEGAAAPAHLCEGIRCVVEAGAQVVLVVRGGGSFEDLMPFNDEGLARSIAACPVPVVTGIGHEPDTSIADMVADCRASTPTAAAEAAAPDASALRARLDGASRSLQAAVRARLEREDMRVSRLADRDVLSNPLGLFSDAAQELDSLAERLPLAIPRALEKDRVFLGHCASRMAASAPASFARLSARLDADRGRLVYQGEALPARFGAQLAVSASRLNDLSPLSVLARGYAMARDERGAIVKSVEGVSAGDDLLLVVHDGEMRCRVEETRKIVTAFESMEETHE